MTNKYPGRLKTLYSVNIRIQSECWKIRTKKNSVLGHFSRSLYFVNEINHCLISARFWSFSGLYFPAVRLNTGLNTKIYSVNLRIQSECGKIGTRESPNMDTFYTVNVCLLKQFWGICYKHEWMKLYRRYKNMTINQLWLKDILRLN